MLDFICQNKYFGWYEDVGYLETVTPNFFGFFFEFHKKFKKPIILSEYGADTMPGLHQVKKWKNF